ncbi:MAG: tetratricopeptide repeat protein [Chthoniobacteraceae bacterium]|nr:tetratricopeptide repeat protein [Chthoniobacteraceae bacterium]
MDTLGELSSGQFLRGLLLKEQRRYAEAESYFREALAQDPRDAATFHHLADSIFQIDGREAEALAPVNEAIALEPNEAAHHALKAFILCSIERPKEALGEARTAVELEPDNAFPFVAEAQTFLCLERWADAEQSARHALVLDPDHIPAANLLAKALRMQNKLGESEEQIAGMLARAPENAYTHANAGWTSLQNGDRRKAEEHFLESLRLDPGCDTAREGLLQSFRARSPFYRAYLNYCYQMQRFSGKTRWAIVLGIYFGVRFARQLFHGPYAPIGFGIAVLYIILVLWIWVARSVGNFILLFDRFARHALRRDERRDAWCVGGSLLLAALFGASGFLAHLPRLLMPAVALCAASIPLSLIFTNRSKPGRALFGLAALYVLGVGAACGITGFGDNSFLLLLSAIFTAACCTWLGNVPFFKKA